MNPAINRTLTDEFERTMETRVVGVTANAIDVIRVADQARFSIPLQKLSTEDRAFATALLKTIIESRPLPETPLVKAVNRDFQVFDATQKRLVPVESGAYASTRIFIIAKNYLNDPDYVFSTSRRDREGQADKNTPPVLWILLNGEAAMFQLAGEKLPAGHAVIGYEARENVVKQEQALQSEFVSSWYNRNRSGSSGGQAFTPSEKERADFAIKLKKVLPPYWPESDNPYVASTVSRQYPWFKAIYRDGTPVRFRGSDLSGSLKVVTTVLREHAAELE